MTDQAEPLIVLFKEITKADVLKMQNKSNQSQTGGGARDFRFPYKPFDEVISQMLPETKWEPRRRDLSNVPVEIRFGVVWVERQPISFDWEPPTDARPSEARIPRIGQLMPIPDMDKGMVLFMLILDSQGRTGAYFAYEDHLTSGEWQPRVAIPILKCLSDSRKSGRGVQGYIDLRIGRTYCHGES